MGGGQVNNTNPDAGVPPILSDAGAPEARIKDGGVDEPGTPQSPTPSFDSSLPLKASQISQKNFPLLSNETAEKMHNFIRRPAGSVATIFGTLGALVGGAAILSSAPVVALPAAATGLIALCEQF